MWEPNLGPLQEQPVLLATESSLQPPFFFIFLNSFDSPHYLDMQSDSLINDHYICCFQVLIIIPLLARTHVHIHVGEVIQGTHWGNKVPMVVFVIVFIIYLFLFMCLGVLPWVAGPPEL